MAGGCETIPVIIQAHQNSEHVAGAGCDVIAFMAENNNAANSAGSGSGSGFAARLGHAGGCEAVIRWCYWLLITLFILLVPPSVC